MAYLSKEQVDRMLDFIEWLKDTLERRKEIVLSWPTLWGVVTQGFGERPEYYRQFGLPGHEGIDIRALYGSPILAAHPGAISAVHQDNGRHNYGTHIKIDHPGQWQTTYAHLSKATTTVGEWVNAGDRIGLSGSTGNSAAAHLHLTLKIKGATARGETIYPYDIVDPTPYFEEWPGKWPEGASDKGGVR